MVLDPNAEGFDEYVRANTDNIDPNVLRDVMNGVEPDGRTRFRVDKVTFSAWPPPRGTEDFELSAKGTFHVKGRPKHPDVFVKVDEPPLWRSDTSVNPEVRVGDVVRVGPRSWRPGDDPLAMMSYEVVEEIEPGVFRLEARPR